MLLEHFLPIRIQAAQEGLYQLGGGLVVTDSFALVLREEVDALVHVVEQARGKLVAHSQSIEHVRNVD